jgi:hypothetical protein
MIALLLAFFALVSGTGSHGAAHVYTSAAASASAHPRPVLNPLSGHPLAG